jgi:hypothetical protein
MPDFPVHEDLDIQAGQTVFKSQKWWKAVVLYEGYRGLEIAVYLWQDREGEWRRQQKYVIRSLDDWEQDKEIIEKFVTEL